MGVIFLFPLLGMSFYFPFTVFHLLLLPLKTLPTLPVPTTFFSRCSSSHRKRRLILKVDPSGIKKWSRSMIHRLSIWDAGFLRGNFSLQIDPLLNDDTGIYEMLVKYGSSVWCCQVKLGVVSVTANPPGPLVELGAVKLTCNCTRSEKPIKIRWFHAGLPIPTTGRFISQGQALFISSSFGNDSGPWLCQLIFADGEIISATYELQVIGFTEKTIPVVYTAAGSDANLPCILNYKPLDYGISDVAVHWKHMGRREMKATATSIRGNQRNFSLYLPAVGPEDAGQYLCEVTIQGTTITQNVTLAIMTVIRSSEGTAVTEGSHLMLTCNLSYHTGQERFRWQKLGSMPTESASRKAEVLKHTLEISPVSLSDAGTWECQVYGPDEMLGSVQHRLEITAAQVSSSQPGTPGKVIFGLMVGFFILVISVLALTHHVRKRVTSSNFPALELMVAATLPGKKEKVGDPEEKVQQMEY
uniref:Lymphocyte activation gene 3 protein n=1 Tax=Anolis carolinensis TaxID=28377 RepID=H9GAP6_ANOCA